MNWKLIVKYTMSTVALFLGICFFTGIFSIRSNIAIDNKKQDSQTKSAFKTDNQAKVLNNIVEPEADVKTQINEAYGKLPLTFEANDGQVDSQVQYLSRGNGYNLFLTATEAVIALRSPVKDDESSFVDDKTIKPASDKQSVLRIKLIDANAAPEVEGFEPLPGKSNYFVGNDPQKWHTNVNQFARIKYSEVYPGVDVVYYGNQKQLEYDFIVAAGTNPDIIKLNFAGADNLALDEKGDLVFETGGNKLRQHKPFVYQEIDGKKDEIAGQYIIKDKQQISFEVADYDKSKPLIIDPVFSYSTYLGGSSDEFGNGIAVDSLGNAYVTGYTSSLDFPAVNPLPYHPTNTSQRFAFITKLSASGSWLVYSTYLGGSGGGTTESNSIAVDASGNAYITGFVTSYNGTFPTVNAYQPTMHGYNDVFVSKLNSTGSALIFSTFLGGYIDNNETGRGIAVDNTGNIYVVGDTRSPDFPLVNPIQPAYGGFSNDGFITKFNPSGSALIYSTYLGGGSYDQANAVAVDSLGNAYVTGYTYSNDFPTANALQPDCGCSLGNCGGNNSVFVTKLNPTGSAFIYSTFLGGNGNEEGRSIAVDSSGNAYVTGNTGSSNFPTVNPIQATQSGGGAFCGASDAFISKLNPTGSALLYSTYLGGYEADGGNGIAVDSEGSAYVTGDTAGLGYSSTVPTVNAPQPIFGGGRDAFITKINPLGSALDYYTFLGGNGYDIGRAIAVDSSGNAYVAGRTLSNNFPTVRPPQPIYGGGSYGDAFVTKVGNSIAPLPEFSISAITPNRGGNTGLVSVTIHGSGFVNGATVKLVSAGLPDIIATTVSISEDGTVARTRFDLTGQAPGVRDVVVTNPNGSAAIRNQGFAIEVNGYPDVWIDIIGRSETRLGASQTFYIYYGNRGNLDSKATPLFVAFPQGIRWKPGFQIIPPPQSPKLPQIDWSNTSIDYLTEDGRIMLPLIIPPMAPGATGVLPIQLIVPPDYPTPQVPIPVSAWTSPSFGVETYPASEPGGTVSGGGSSSNDCMKSVNDLGIELFGVIDLPCAVSGTQYTINTIGGIVNQDGRPSAGSILQYGFEGAIFGAECAAKIGEKTSVGILTAAYTSFRVGFGIGNVLNGCFGADKKVEKFIRVFFSIDPNDKVGATGIGQSRYLSGEEPLRYSIYFENKPEASAPAQDVVITDQLDTSKLDFDTFSLGPISFGANNLIVPPSGLSEFTNDVDLRPENNLIVRINAKLDKTTGLLTWRFQSLDPTTMQPTDDPRAGFLPPNINAPEGDGQVLFTVQPKDNLATGTEIRNKARIIFDTNAPIDTPEWLNTIDNSKPVSQVNSLSATQSSNKFTVKWSGTDTGSGIQSYSIYVSENGGPFNVWRQDTTDTSGVFTGSADTTYAFYSVAKDRTGNNENAPATADATTRTPLPDTTPPSITITAPTATNYLLGQNVLANYSCGDGGSGVASCTGQTVNGAAIDTSSVGTKTFRVTATDNAGNSTSQTVTYKVSYKIVALFDQTKLNNSGSTITVKLQIGNAQGVNYSAANIAVMALRIMPGNLSVQSSGNSQPGNLFKFEDGTYQFNLKSEKSWTSGTYQLFFSVTDDPIEHSVEFRIR